MPNDARLEEMERKVDALQKTVFALIAIQLGNYTPHDEVRCPWCPHVSRADEFGYHFSECVRRQ